MLTRIIQKQEMEVVVKVPVPVAVHEAHPLVFA